MNYKIAHLTSVHKPGDTRIFIKECKTLKNFFNEVVFIVPCEKSEIIEGIRIHAIPFAKSRKERFLKTSRFMYKAALQEDADVYHFHDPELIPIGLLLKIKGKKVIYDVHEDVPKQILSKLWIPKALRKIVSAIMAFVEKISVKAFDGIVAATPAIGKRFPTNKTIVVQNFPIINELFIDNNMDYNKRPNNVIYIGGISTIRGFKEMVKAMNLLPQNLNAKLFLAGSFTPASLEKELYNLPGWRSVEFLGWKKRNDIAQILNSSRIGLVVLHPTENYVESYPIKLFEYMSVGIPVIASDFPLWRKIINEAKCGLLVDPLCVEAIADAIQWLLEHPQDAEQMGRRGQEAVLKHYNWDNEAKKLIKFYKKLLKT